MTRRLAIALVLLFSFGCADTLANVERKLTGAEQIQDQLDEVAGKLQATVDLAREKVPALEAATNEACKLFPDGELCDEAQSLLADLQRQIEIADEVIAIYRKTGLRFDDCMAAAKNSVALAAELYSLLEDLRQGAL